MTAADCADVAPATGIVWAYRFAPDGSATALAAGDVDAAASSA